MSADKRTLSVRIEAELYQKLQDLAGDARTNLTEVTVGLLVRGVTRVGEPADIGEQLVEIKRTLSEIRHDLPLVARAILTASTQEEQISPDAAEEWAKGNLRTQD